VLCDDDARSVELLDLWEAEAVDGLAITRGSTPILEQVDHAIAVFRAAGMKQLTAEAGPAAHALYESVVVRAEGRLPAGIAIAPPSDALNRYLPRGCSLVGIALYNDKFSTLDVDGLLFDRLSPTSKAALIVHEAVYKFLRDTFAIYESTPARKLVGCAFADVPCPTLARDFGLPATGPLYSCTLPLYGNIARVPRFWVFPLAASTTPGRPAPWRFQFQGYGADESPGRAYFDAPIIDAAFEPESDVIRPAFRRKLLMAGSLPSRTSDFVTRSDETRTKDLAIDFTFRLSEVASTIELEGSDLGCEQIH
jgi:hypothetical protein